MKLRNYQDGDETAIADLWQRAGLMQNPLNDPRKDIAFCLAGGHGEILVLEDEGKVVATAMVGQDGHRGWIYYVAVEPDRQGQLLGRRIVRAAEDHLKAQGVPKIHLMVRGSNTDVVGFYQRLGYRVEPVTTMSRRLDGNALAVGHQMDDAPGIITYLVLDGSQETIRRGTGEYHSGRQSRSLRTVRGRHAGRFFRTGRTPDARP